MTDQRNIIIAFVISVAILLGFQYFYKIPRVRQATETASQQPANETTPASSNEAAPTSPAVTPNAAGDETPAPPPTAGATAEPKSAPDRATALAASPRLPIETPTIMGSIALTGARLDDLTLVKYHETVDPKSPAIILLSPPGAAHPYYARFGWAAADPAVAVPGPDSEWRADASVLRPDRPVTLSWDNGQGLRFIQRVAIDENYIFTVTQAVENKGNASVTLVPYGLLSRTGTPKTLGYYILHEGLLGVLNGTLEEIGYKKIKEEGEKRIESTGGWLGITDKYWLAALIPTPDASIRARFLHTTRKDIDKYQADFQRQPMTVAPGAKAEVEDRFFAGAKVVQILDGYEAAYKITLFNRAVDFGYLWFLTRPIFFVIDYFYRLTGNFGIAILLLTVIIKGLFFPLANKSYKAMSKMKKLQPKMKEMREEFGGDKQKLQQAMMKLYKAEKVNPMSGCLPIVVQIPVFFSLYKVLFVTIEMRHTPFFGWIHDLSARDPATIFNLFGMIPVDLPSFLNIGVWPLIMGFTMYLQQRLNPQPPDPTQAKIMMMLPVVFTFMFARFPAGLVIYWTWNNLLSIAQQWTIMRRAGVST